MAMNKKQLRMHQKAVLYDLLMIEQAIKVGNAKEVIGNIIYRTIAAMDADDVASAKEKFNKEIKSAGRS